MAGTLPGVEAARRRRIHHRCCGGAAGGGCTRRPLFSLFVGNFDPNPFSSSSAKQIQRSEKNRTSEDENLGKVAREAKERLDERLRAKRTSHTTRNKSDMFLGEERAMVVEELRTEVFGCGKNRLMRWARKLRGSKALEQEDCVVCLDGFMVGDKLVSLPCAHRFHSSCLLPWLQHHPHCPCCRIPVLP